MRGAEQPGRRVGRRESRGAVPIASAGQASPGRGVPISSCLHTQVLPKLSSSIIHEIDSILGNKPYSKKDYRS